MRNHDGHRDAVPIPEMIGGVIIGAVASMVLTYSAELRSILVPTSPLLYITVAIAALVGVAISYFLARARVVDLEVPERPPMQMGSGRLSGPPRLTGANR